MTARTPSFYGSVLKAIACTPNRNPDARAYDVEVLPRAKRLREAQARLGEASPTGDEMSAALSDLVAILRAKLVAEDEIGDRLREIQELHPATHPVAPPSTPVPHATNAT